VQNVSHKQFKNRYFGSLFLDSSTFVIWTREKFDSWNVYKEGISSQNEAIKNLSSEIHSQPQVSYSVIQSEFTSQ